MRKKLFAAMLTVISAIACAVGITSCSVRSEDNKPCEHSYVYTKLDAENHSGECSKCHDTVTEKHEFSGDKCEKCGYDRTTESFTVTFDANGGTLSGNSTQTVKYNGTVTEPAEPNRGGYKFVGWTSGSGSTLWDFATGKITSDTTLKASWLQIFDVTFDANGGKFADDSATLSVKATDGDKLEVPDEPARAGAVFVGWFGDDKLTLEWNFDTDTVVSDKTLYAGWKITERDVTFVLNFEGAENVTETTQDGLVTYVPTRTGYVFNGWWLSDGQTSDGSYILTQKWDVSETVLSDGLVLYAEWVEESTVATQLPAPSITIDGNVLSWDEVENARGYRVQIRKSGETEPLYDETVTDTRLYFPSNYEAGYYNVSVRSNGDGINAANSAYVTKSYAHKILTMPANIKFDVSTSVLTWSPVKYATSYSVYVGGELAEETERTVFDMSAYDAGTHNIRIVAERYDYKSSSATKQIEKLRLKAPNVLLRVDKEHNAYYLIWEPVSGADSYIIKLNDNEITVSETVYTLAGDGELWGEESSGSLCVNAFDSKADYIVSVQTQEFNVAKLYTVTVGSDIDGAGDLTVSGDLYRLPEYTVSFNLNGAYGTAPETQHVTSTKGLKYPEVPTRDGYVFSGWCLDTKGKNKFDFADEVKSDMTLYAGWHEIKTSGKRNVVVDIAKTANSSSSYHQFSSSASYYEPDYLYFTAHKTGEYRISFVSFVYGESNYGSHFYVYNVTQNKVVLDIDCNSSYWYENATNFSANAGDVIYVKNYKSNTSKGIQAWVYVTGGDYPEDAVCNDNYYMSAESSDKCEALSGNGSAVTVTAEPASENYTFLGWYDGDTLLSNELAYTFDMPAKDVNYTAKWLQATLTTAVNDETAGTVTEISGEAVISGREITVVATTNDGYTFLGWYDGDTLLSNELSYTFIMPDKDLTCTAKWFKCRITVEKNSDEAGTVTDIPSNTLAGQQVTLTATTNNGYTFLGWYNGDTLLSGGLTYTFTMHAEEVVYTAKWMVCPVTAVAEDAEAGSVSGIPATSVLGDEITLIATTNDGYTFTGWYVGDEKVSDNEEYTFELTTETKAFTAKWVFYTLSLNSGEGGGLAKRVSFNLNGGQGEAPADQIVTAENKLTYPAIPMRTDHYGFKGWYTDASCRTLYNFTADVTQDIVLYAGWEKIGDVNSKYIDITKHTASYDSYSVALNGSGTVYYHTYFTILKSGSYSLYYLNASYDSSSDYAAYITAYNVTQNGRYIINDRKCPTSYDYVTFSANAGDIICVRNSKSRNAVAVRLYVSGAKLPDDGGICPLKESSEKVTAGKSVTCRAGTNSGYNFLGWYDGDTLISDQETYTFKMPAENVNYTAKWCKFSITNSNDTAGSTECSGTKFLVGDRVTVTAKPNDGYVFTGWYSGDEKLSGEPVYSFDFVGEDVEYVAKWIECPVTLEKNSTVAGEVSPVKGCYLGEEVTVSASTNEGYIWLGWYDGDTELTKDTSYAFTMTEESKTFTAKWSTNVEYLDEHGNLVQCTDAELRYLDSADINELSNWYLLSGAVTSNRSFSVAGKAYIILADGCDWNLSNLYVEDDAELYIYAQSSGDNAGKLTIDGNLGGQNGGNGSEGSAGPRGEKGGNGYAGSNGGNCGTVVINGGVVSCKALGGGNGGNGGKGGDGGNGGAIVVNGGVVSCETLGGGKGGTGGQGGDGGSNFTGGYGAIGGDGGSGGTVTINGGNVTVKQLGGGDGGIGGRGGYRGSGKSDGNGGRGGNGGDGGALVINGGTFAVEKIVKGSGSRGGYGSSDGSYGSSGASGKIFYKGTSEEWTAVGITSSDSVVYFYSESEPALNADGTAYDGNFWHLDTDGVTPVIWVKETPEETV